MISEKKKYQQLLMRMVEALKPYYSNGKAELDLGAPTAAYGARIGKMEGFSRILWGLTPYWAGGGTDNSMLSVYLEGIRNGVDPNSKEYWGDLQNKDQRMVEMAAISYSILMIPDKIWEPLSEETKRNLAVWLNQINSYSQAENNWQYFNVLTNLALKSVGMSYSEERMELAMEKYESFYLDNGWYSDGLRPQKDYYISFAIHYYCLLYAKVMKAENPVRSQLFRERATQFAQTFVYWFDDEGKAIPFGRSQTYRFAQAAFWSACALTELECFKPGVIKGLIFRHMDYWMKQPIFDREGILTVGYTYPNLTMSEGYNSSGSPYWAFKTFAFLGLPDDHEFWNCEVEGLPCLEAIKAIPECDMLIQHRLKEVVALTAGQYPVMAHTHAAEKYAKFAYSSKFGFSVPRSYHQLSEAGTDSMLVFYTHGMHYVRRKCKEFNITESYVYSKWSPVDGIEVETFLIPDKGGHIRKHRIESTMECIAYDCGFSYPDGLDTLDKEQARGMALVKDKFGRSEVYSDSGEGEIIHCAPNVNIIYPLSCIPAIRYEIKPGIQEFVTKVYAKHNMSDK